MPQDTAGRAGGLKHCCINHNIIRRRIFCELCRSFVMRSRAINKVCASPVHLFFPPLPRFLDDGFPLSSLQTIFKDWSTSLDIGKEENNSGAWGRACRGSGVLIPGSMQGCRWLTLCRGHGVPHPKGPSREGKRSSI